MRRWVVGYVAGCAPLVAAVFVLPRYHLVLWGLLGWCASAAVVVGVVKNRPDRRLPWLLVAGALAVFVTGDIVYDVLTDVLGYQRPFPSVADGLYLMMYPLLGCGLLGLMRARSRERNLGLLLDALIITALCAPPWLLLIEPYVRGGDMTLLERVVSISYPLGDIAVVCVLARLVLSRGLVNWSVRLLTIGALGLLVSDLLYGNIQLHAQWRVGGPTDAGWVAFYVCWGASALHPSMREFTSTEPQPKRRLGMNVLVVLGAITLVGPGLLVWQAASGGMGGEVGAIGVASAVVFLLVMARLTMLARAQAVQVERERTLRLIGERLVGASELQAVDSSAVAAVESLVGPQVMVCMVTVAQGRLERVVAARPEELIGVAFDQGIGGQDNSLVARLAGGDLVPGSTRDTHWTSFTFGGTNSARRRVLIGHQGTLHLGSTDVGDALAAQLTLAADRVQLGEDLNHRKSEARFRSLIRNASDVILVVQADGHIRSETPSIEAVLGYEADAAATLRLSSLVHADDRGVATATIDALLAGPDGGPTRGEWQIRHADGGWLDMEVIANNLSEDAEVGGVVLTLRDVSDRKVLEQELRHQASHDSLTGLPNRVLFNDRVDQALSRRSRLGTNVSVLLLDIDDFKVVNDTLGHPAGDQLLVHFAARLLGCLRGNDTAARLGGDEFAVCIEMNAHQSDIAAAAQRILEAMAQPFTVVDTELDADVSIGIATADDATQGSTDMMRQADLALYAAKNAGKGSFHFFEDRLHHAELARLEQRVDLEAAIHDDKLHLHYQPIVRLDTGAMVGVEALVRWDHPTLGIIPATQFMTLAEDSGLVVPLGRWVLDRACSDLNRWQRRWNGTGRRPFTMTVNISARQLQSPTLVELVDQTLCRHDIDPAWLTFDITENLLVEASTKAMARLDALHARGIGLALDDFGAGSSSLRYLHRFPIQTIKIDPTFLAGINHVDQPDDHPTVIGAVVAMANALGLRLDAQRIENQSQTSLLRDLGCTYGQGFHFGRPVPAGSIDQLIDRACPPRSGVGRHSCPPGRRRGQAITAPDRSADAASTQQRPSPVDLRDAPREEK